MWGFASSALATPITYVLTGDLTGTLGATPLPNDPFTWTITGDTASLTTVAGVPAVPAITDTIFISGIGNVLPTLQLFTAVNAGSSIAGYVNSTAVMGLSWTAPALSTWDAVTPIGPLAVTFFSSGAFPTNEGSLSITNATTMVFTATLMPTLVPEPSSLVLLLAGIAGVIGWVAVARDVGRAVGPDFHI